MKQKPTEKQYVDDDDDLPTIPKLAVPLGLCKLPSSVHITPFIRFEEISRLLDSCS